MKLSRYAKNNSITYLTAYRHWRQGLIKGRQLASGTIVVEETPDINVENSNCARLYGLRRTKRKTEKLLEQLARQ